MNISIIKPDHRHLEQLVKLLTITSYDSATAKYNTLHLDAISYIKEYKLIPLLPLTRVAIDNSDTSQVLGMIISAPLKQINESTKISYSHPQTKPIFEKFYDVYENEIPTSYNIFRFAVDKRYRNKGIGEHLLMSAEQESHRLNFSMITVTVWSCQVDAIRLYLKFGMEIKKCYHISDKIPYPTLIYLEKILIVNSKPTTLKLMNLLILNYYGHKQRKYCYENH